jgi:hypothetical protein
MEKEQMPHDIDFDRLLEEFGLTDGGVPTSEAYLSGLYDVAPIAAVETVRHARILDQSQRWIAFLERQTETLARLAWRLYDRLAASSDLKPKAAVIEQLEWTLIALECWIEEQMPTHGDAQFRVRWVDGDGLAAWVMAGRDVAVPTSLRQIVADGAETEGKFSADVADAVAVLIVAGMRGGDIQLPRLRQLSDDSSPESVFELVARGEEYRVAVAMADDSASLPPELEAQLDRNETGQLATLLDQVSYDTARSEVTRESREPLFTRDIVDGITRIAERCHIPSAEMARCLMSLVEGRLDAALRARDSAASVRLAKAASALTRVVLQER